MNRCVLGARVVPGLEGLFQIWGTVSQYRPPLDVVMTSCHDNVPVPPEPPLPPLSTPHSAAGIAPTFTSRRYEAGPAPWPALAKVVPAQMTPRHDTLSPGRQIPFAFPGRLAILGRAPFLPPDLLLARLPQRQEQVVSHPAHRPQRAHCSRTTVGALGGLQIAIGSLGRSGSLRVIRIHAVQPVALSRRASNCGERREGALSCAGGRPDLPRRPSPHSRTSG